jgi:uncharacterized coiled-coil protein SlyX
MGQITQGGAMRQTEQERLADLEARSTFQHQTLRTIRVVAERAPPEEALAEAEPEAHKHRASE